MATEMTEIPPNFTLLLLFYNIIMGIFHRFFLAKEYYTLFLGLWSSVEKGGQKANYAHPQVNYNHKACHEYWIFYSDTVQG